MPPKGAADAVLQHPGEIMERGSNALNFHECSKLKRDEKRT